jgi:hypothetical protein
MSDATKSPLSLSRATGISAALHLLLLPFFVAAPFYVGAGHASDASSLWGSDHPDVVSTMTIVHRVHRRAVAARPVPAAEKVAKTSPTAPKPARPVAVARTRKQDSMTPRAAVARVAPHPGLLSMAPAALEPAATHPQPVEQPATVATTAPSAPPTAAPAPTGGTAVAMAVPTHAASEMGVDASTGGWGQNFEKPILADESGLSDLRGKYHGSISVRVDESGHATRVLLPDSIPADARDEIERRFTTLRYVPAECNGLRCAGTLTITL